MIKVPVIGGAGNVGRGIVLALKKAGFDPLVIDPQINSSFESLSFSKMKKIFSKTNNVIYTAERGSREEYEKDSRLALKNNQRFNNFCRQVAKLNEEIVVWYIGGSWTKRKPDKSWLVTDFSPNKPMSQANAYEKAKIMAEKNARKLSQEIKIRFLDWISIVPNLSENFTIFRMTRQALIEGIIKYSPGNYGRPLLSSVQAGEALILLMESDDRKINFKKYLIPGIFIRFEEFAKAVKTEVEKETKRKIVLETIPKTPDFLKSQTLSYHLQSLGFQPQKKEIISALGENARDSLTKILKGASSCQ